MAMFDDQRGIVYRDHKLIMYPKAGAAELYDLEKDPWEISDILEEVKGRNLLGQMSGELFRWQEETGDTLDMRLIYPWLQ
jgi:hypothetical protein